MTPKARFFFALRPDAGAAAALGALAARLAAGLGGRSLSARDVHLTLAFIGERPAAEAPSLLTLLAGIAPRWPALPMARLGTFGRGLLWVGVDPAAVPAWPTDLAEELRARLHATGIAFDQRALHLHATLVRGARRDARPPFAGLDDALPIGSEYWSLALGWSAADSTPQQRYRWREAPG